MIRENKDVFAQRQHDHEPVTILWRQLTLFLVLPIVMIVIVSFWQATEFSIVPAFDFENYEFLFGSPVEIAEQILDLIHRFGVNHFVMGVQFPGMPQKMVLDEMQMLSEEVFPLVRAGI